MHRRRRVRRRSRLIRRRKVHRVHRKSRIVRTLPSLPPVLRYTDKSSYGIYFDYSNGMGMSDNKFSGVTFDSLVGKIGAEARAYLMKSYTRIMPAQVKVYVHTISLNCWFGYVRSKPGNVVLSTLQKTKDVVGNELCEDCWNKREPCSGCMSHLRKMIMDPQNRVRQKNVSWNQWEVYLFRDDAAMDSTRKIYVQSSASGKFDTFAPNKSAMCKQYTLHRGLKINYKYNCKCRVSTGWAKDYTFSEMMDQCEGLTSVRNRKLYFAPVDGAFSFEPESTDKLQISIYTIEAVANVYATYCLSGRNAESFM